VRKFREAEQKKQETRNKKQEKGEFRFHGEGICFYLQGIEHQAAIKTSSETLHHETISELNDVHNRVQVKYFFLFLWFRIVEKCNLIFGVGELWGKGY